MEEVKERDVKVSGDRDVLIYREQLAPIIALMHALGFERKAKWGSPVAIQSDAGHATRQILMVHFGDRFFGLEISRILDIAQPTSEIDRYLKDRQGILGSVFVGDQSVTVIDAPELLSSAGFSLPSARESRQVGSPPTDILSNVVPLKAVPSSDRASEPQVLKASGDHSDGSEGWGLF